MRVCLIWIPLLNLRVQLKAIGWALRSCRWRRWRWNRGIETSTCMTLGGLVICRWPGRKSVDHHLATVVEAIVVLDSVSFSFIETIVQASEVTLGLHGVITKVHEVIVP